MLVTKAQLSQAGSFQLPPKNTSEVIPSKAQNPEIKRGSKSPVIGLAWPRGCGSGRLQLALKQRGKEQNMFSKELGRAGHGLEKTIRMETQLSSSPPQCSCLPLSPLGPAPVCPAWQGTGGCCLVSDSHWLSDLIFLHLDPGFPGFITPFLSLPSIWGEWGKLVW